MKKWWLIVPVFIALAIAGVYIFVPGSAAVAQRKGLGRNAEALRRNLLNEKAWKDWWPGTKDSTGKGLAAYTYQGFTYTITDKTFNAFAIEITGPHFKSSTLFNLTALGTDSLDVLWEGKFSTGTNPIERVGAWQSARAVKKNMGVLLQRLRDYYTPEHLYALPIREEHVRDSTLVSTYGESADYPGTEFIYGLIDELRAYAATQSAEVTGAPMLNVVSPDGKTYLTRVALPVNKVLAPSGRISYKWMLGGGNILVADVTGGPEAIEAAQRELELYVADHGRIAPAISFQSLVSDRRRQRDTVKWLTRLYFPVM